MAMAMSIYRTLCVLVLLQTSLKPQCRFSQFSLYCFYLFFGDFPILNESITKFIYGSINFKMVFWGLHSPCMVYHSPWLVKKKTSQFKPLFKTEHTNRTRRQYLVIVKIVMLMLVESRFINRLDAGERQLHKGSPRNKFSVKVGNLAQPAWPPPLPVRWDFFREFVGNFRQQMVKYAIKTVI